VRATASAWFTDLRLGPALERILGTTGRSDAPEAVHRTWLLLRLRTPPAAAPKAARSGPSKGAIGVAAGIAAGWLADDDLRTFLGVHEAGGTTWLRAEPLGRLAAWSLALTTADGDTGAVAEALDRVVGAAADSGYALDPWLARLDGTGGNPAKAPTTRAPSKKPVGAAKRTRSARGR
jgi:hypothetical protein